MLFRFHGHEIRILGIFKFFHFHRKFISKKAISGLYNMEITLINKKAGLLERQRLIPDSVHSEHPPSLVL